jgi:hypothetical protein
MRDDHFGSSTAVLLCTAWSIAPIIESSAIHQTSRKPLIAEMTAVVSPMPKAEIARSDAR